MIYIFNSTKLVIICSVNINACTPYFASIYEHCFSVVMYSLFPSNLVTNGISMVFTSNDNFLQIVEFSIKENNYTEWTLEHMYHFPHMWQKSQHKIREVMYNSTDLQQIIVCDIQHLTILDKRQARPKCPLARF